MTAYTFRDFEITIAGQPIGTAKEFHSGEFIEATRELPPFGLEPIEFTIDLSPETTGRMPDCVKRTRRSRRRWRGKGQRWNSLFKDWI